ncbi:MAG: hypothetical protein RIS45_1567 [Planctomycetota bacterium]
MTEIIELPREVTSVDAPGFYMVPHTTYHGPDFTPTPAISQSLVKTILEKSPAHAWHESPALNPEAERRASRPLDLGTAVHSLVLGRGADIIEVPADSYRSKNAQELRDTAAAAGQCPLLTKDYELAVKIADAVRATLRQIPDCEHAFDPDRGFSEVAAVWKEGDAWLKCQMDYVTKHRATVWDLKTSSAGAAPAGLGRLMVDRGYDIQGAMALRALAHLDPETRGRTKVRFVVVEVVPPFGLSVIELDNTAITMGTKRLEMGIRLMKQCLKSNTWPSYPALIHRPEYPGWAENQFLAREITEPDMHKASPNYQVLADNWQRPA